MFGMTPAVKWLLIVNTAIFVLCYLLPSAGAQLMGIFGLTPTAVVHYFAVWQLFTYLFLHHIGNPDAVTIGASGAIYGLLLGFGMLFPDARILFFFLFPIPARIYVWIMAAIVFLSTLGDTGGSVSHFAHLGGIVCGYVFFRLGLDRVRWPEFHPLESIGRQYREWKMQRAKRKFKVYLRKHGQSPRDDRWVN